MSYQESYDHQPSIHLRLHASTDADATDLNAADADAGAQCHDKVRICITSLLITHLYLHPDANVADATVNADAADVNAADADAGQESA